MTALERAEFEAYNAKRKVSDEQYAGFLKNGVLPSSIADPEADVERDVELLGKSAGNNGLQTAPLTVRIDNSSGLPFVIKPVAGKGLGVFATQSFKKGAEIFREACILGVKSESKTWLQAEASINVISSESKKKYLALAEECGCKEGPCVETRVMRIWRANAFHNHMADMRGEYIYEFASRINHSCVPNSSFSFTKEGHIVFFATRDIKKGIEITHDYKGAFGTAEMRRKKTLDEYGFVCQCTACKDNIVISPTHFINAFRSGQLSEVKSQGTTVLGGQTFAEVAALRLVAGWTQKVMAELGNMQMKIHYALLMHTSATGKFPEAHSPFVKEQFALVEKYLKSQNYFGLSDEFYAYFLSRITPLILETMKEALKHCSAISANFKV
ncbi:hypothetical protein BKA65DRAFT_397157 [Rhexocercosporidium sp. MPI-PUGE-AT-0058]|nr:hypothetical protein BKA65DRAFT_397157 [Rhexocercosporidium sp. MPI-PUGE-AT-0058]